MVKFEESRWSEAIKKPDWYMEFVPYAKKVYEKLAEASAEWDEFNKTTRHFFEKALQEGSLALAEQGPNLDEQREPVDTIVIHHTSSQPGYALSFMNITQLLNIYAPYFYNPTDEREKFVKGKAIWSNHFRDGKPSFLAYHWLMRMDGSCERLLEDRQIGWHAGNWEINKRSIAICLDNDYEEQDPTDDVLQKLALHIKRFYPDVQTKNIIGHCEARSGTICPGTNFLSSWKGKLLNYLP